MVTTCTLYMMIFVLFIALALLLYIISFSGKVTRGNLSEDCQACNARSSIGANETHIHTPTPHTPIHTHTHPKPPYTSTYKARKQANKQASKQANKQASKQANK